MNKSIKLFYHVSAFKRIRWSQGPIVKKVLLLGIVSVLILESPSNSEDTLSPYANVFNEDIYDQSKILRRKDYDPNSLHDEALNKRLLQELFTKKVQHLENKVFSECDRELNDIKILMEDNKTSDIVKVLNLMGKTLSTASSFALLGVLPGTGTAVATTRAVIGGTAGVSAAGGIMTGLHDFFQPEGQVDLEKMKAALERQKKNLIEGLHKEPISDLEIAYVLRKRFYTSSEITKQIESALLMTRIGKGLPLEFSISFLENCLNLPFQKKVINQQDKWFLLDENFDPTLSPSQKEAKTKLIAYEEETKNKLEKIIASIVLASNSDEPSYSRFYYFWGKPGLGKSTAARAIAEFLDLPYYEMNIRTGDDISQRSLEGGDWQRQLATPGHIALALLAGSTTGNKNDEYVNIKVPFNIASKYFLSPEIYVRALKNKSKNTHLNSVLIINDFDRLLLDPSTSTQVLAFLLDYLDPEKKEFHSPYFRGPVNTSGLLVFKTGNHKIPDEDGKFDALKDRSEEVEFKAFREETQRSILSSFYDSKIKICKLRNESKDVILNSICDVESLRRAKKSIEEKLTEKFVHNLKIPKIIEVKTDQEDSYSDLDLSISSDSENLINDDLDNIEKYYDGSKFYRYPPIFQIDNVFRKAKNFHKTVESTLLLYSEDQLDQLKGIRQLLGTYHYSGYWNDNGTIENLWKTTTIATGQHLEEAGSLGAFANRMKRFEVPQYKSEIVRMHIGLLQSITDALLSFQKDDSEENFIYKKINDDKKRLENINFLINHLTLVASIENDCMGEALNLESKKTLENYRNWLGNSDSDQWKGALLLTKYPNPSNLSTVLNSSSSRSTTDSDEKNAATDGESFLMTKSKES